MAGTRTFSSHVTRSALRHRTSAPSRLAWYRSSFYLKLLAKSGAIFALTNPKSSGSDLAVSEGPSCVFVGPVEYASKEVLEALYRQLKLRWYGSKSVVKYPRCSLRRQSTYADAEEDPSQVLALASIWVFFLAIGSSAFLVPIIYAIGLAHQDAVSSSLSLTNVRAALDFLSTVNGILFMGLSSVIGYPIASASVQALQGLWRSDLVALKGPCPNCGEEVFAFVQANQSNQSPLRTDCHVCECSLDFRTKVEQSISRPRRQWVYGRIYLVPGTGKRRRRWT